MQRGCFAISMIVALDHLADPAEAGALSALMQGGGFLITALPPWIVAMLHDLTGSFMAGWLLHLASVAVVVVLNWRMNPGSYAAVMSLPAVSITLLNGSSADKPMNKKTARA